MAKSYNEKHLTCSAGAFSVLSELMKRKVNAVTLSPVNSIRVSYGDLDSCNESDQKCKYIKVKTTRENQVVTSYYQRYFGPDKPKPDYWVLVFIDESYNARFFILTYKELGEVQAKRNNIPPGELPHGCDNLSINDVIEYENAWNTIINCK